jgi:hypothetical protein
LKARDRLPNSWVDGTTDGIAIGRGRTTVDVTSKKVLTLNSRRTDLVIAGRRGRSRHHLQNRWSASLAISTDGSFPARPRQLSLGRSAVSVPKDCSSTSLVRHIPASEVRPKSAPQPSTR